jgi:hypothetical protein
MVVMVPHPVNTRAATIPTKTNASEKIKVSPIAIAKQISARIQCPATMSINPAIRKRNFIVSIIITLLYRSLQLKAIFISSTCCGVLD